MCPYPEIRTLCKDVAMGSAADDRIRSSHQPFGVPKASLIGRARLTWSVGRYTEVVDTEACRKLSLTVVSSAPLAKACVAWVCLIQCGLARRNFSAVFGDSASIASAVYSSSGKWRYLRRLMRANNRRGASTN